MPQQIARCLFDGMPKRRREAEGEDRISALPDALLHHVLSFLPAEQAVRTCVLAPRWRGLWMSAPVLRVTNTGSWKTAESFTDFVYHLLLFRDRPPLGELELESYPNSDEMFGHSEATRFLDTWMRYAVVKCDVGVLRLRYCSQKPSHRLSLLTLPSTPLVSTHLRCLKLERFGLDHRFLNFSTCPALQELIIKCCAIEGAGALSFHSLKRLVLIEVRFGWPSRVRISAPCLVSLHLEDVIGRTPLLENMPSLVTAFIRLGGLRCGDRCLLTKFGDCGLLLCEPCCGTQDGDKAVLLTSISNASNLELIAEHGVGIFKRDLKWFPTFSKLKTLLLNEWSLASGLHAISCFLQHSPMLEKVTLQLNEELEDTIELEERFIPTEKMLQHAQHLKIVEIRYLKMDERVLEVLKILNIFGITLDRINILKTNSLSNCFSFERS